MLHPKSPLGDVIPRFYKIPFGPSLEEDTQHGSSGKLVTCADRSPKPAEIHVSQRSVNATGYTQLEIEHVDCMTVLLHASFNLSLEQIRLGFNFFGSASTADPDFSLVTTGVEDGKLGGWGWR